MQLVVVEGVVVTGVIVLVVVVVISLVTEGVNVDISEVVGTVDVVLADVSLGTVGVKQWL